METLKRVNQSIRTKKKMILQIQNPRKENKVNPRIAKRVFAYFHDVN